MQWITCDSSPCDWHPRMEQLIHSASHTGFPEQHSPVSCSHCPPALICGVSELCYVARAAKGQCNQNESLCIGEVWHSERISPVQSKNWSARVDPGMEGDIWAWQNPFRLYMYKGNAMLPPGLAEPTLCAGFIHISWVYSHSGKLPQECLQSGM